LHQAHAKASLVGLAAAAAAELFSSPFLLASKAAASAAFSSVSLALC